MARLLTDYSKLDNKEKKEYEASLKLLYILLGIATVLFYVLPVLFGMLPQEIRSTIIYLTMVNVYTAYSFIAGMVHARKHGFGIFVPISIAIFFIPTVMIFYGDMRLSFLAVLYFVLGMFGEFTGYLIIRRKKSTRQPIGLNRLVNGKPAKKSKGKKTLK